MIQPSEGPSWGHPLTRIQEVIAEAFGVTAESRETTIRRMLEVNLEASVGYWFQLVLAMMLATLGLVLGSTAVVIGAMLVSPLMGPIVQLGMSLAVGSPVLAIRSMVRTVSSIFLVIGCAALLTLMLPFYEVTTEISSRTAPTALDLIIAATCALAAAYTTIRPKSDTFTAAAGTAIGIALVPPLCVVGFGLGTGKLDIAAGSSLLFTANLSAILVVSVILFLLLGFDQPSLEVLGAPREDAQSGRLPSFRLAQGFQRLFGSRSSAVLRILMPLAFLLAVYLPLRSALEEVSWEVRVRSEINLLLQETPTSRDAVRSLVSIDKQAVLVRLVVLASSLEALRLEERLKTRIAAVAGVVPTVTVAAVPDMAALQAATVERTSRAAPPEPPRAPDLVAAQERLRQALVQAWPAETAGPLLQWVWQPGSQGLEVTVHHLGTPLGESGVHLLGWSLSAGMGARIKVIDRAYSPDPVSAPASEGLRWLPELVRAVDIVSRQEQLTLHVQTPGEPKPRDKAALPGLEQTVQSELRRLPERRQCLTPGPAYRFALSLEGCAQAEEQGTPSLEASPPPG